MGEKSKTDTKNFYCLTTRLEKPLHDKFINRWKWILDTFACLQTLGTRNIIQMIISVIPHFQFKLLVSDFKCDSVDDVFIYLKSIGDNYSNFIDMRTRINYLVEVSARENRQDRDRRAQQLKTQNPYKDSTDTKDAKKVSTK